MSPRLSRWIFNCYVIRTEDGGAVVVDAGLPQPPDDVAPYLDRLDGPIHAIVATHGHSDHVAGAAELTRRYESRIFLPAKTITYLNGSRPRTPTAAASCIWPTLLEQLPVAHLLPGHGRPVHHDTSVWEHQRR